MDEKPISTCSEDSCQDCTIHSRINCHFSLWQLIRFYIFVMPSFIIGGIGVENYSSLFLFIWIAIIGIFFMFIEIRILCSHCPHYGEPGKTLSCWANYGAPKIWRFRPEPMSFPEKFVLIQGFIIIWGYPVIFMILSRHWFLLIGYLVSVLLFFFALEKLYCRICMNLSCPFNCVDKETKERFLANNPHIKIR